MAAANFTKRTVVHSVLSLALTGAALLGAAGFARPATVAPPPAPTITSTGKFLYISGEATNYVGTPGTFTLSDPTAAITGFYYYFGDDGPPGTFIPAGKDGTATLTITPFDLTDLQLYVMASMSPGQPPSAPTLFDLSVTAPPGNIAALAWWKLNAGNDAMAADATGYGKVTEAVGGGKASCAKPVATDGYKCSLSIAGHGGQELTAAPILPVVALSDAATLSAWVNLTTCAGTCVALSEDRGSGYAFALEYQRVCRADGKSGACWALALPAQGSSTGYVFKAMSPPGSAKLGIWTQLTAVLYAEHGQLLIYVDGVQQGQSSYSPGIGGGAIRIGNLAPGGTVHDWNGRISDVCLFYGPMAGADLSILYRGDAAHPHDGCAALVAKYP
jgi:concanavalin A-like lectin/glucanase superfamily protein